MQILLLQGYLMGEARCASKKTKILSWLVETWEAQQQVWLVTDVGLAAADQTIAHHDVL